MEPSYSLGASRCIPEEKFPRKPYNKSLIDQVCSVKMAGYFFFARLWTSTLSRSIKTQRKILTSIQLFWLHTLSITHIYFISLVLYKNLNHILFHGYFLFWNSNPWCAAPTSDLRSQYLQVDLRKIHAVSGVSTQGAYVRSFYDALITEYSWVSSYLVHYSLDGNEWIVLTNKGGEIKVCFSAVHIL